MEENKILERPTKPTAPFQVCQEIAKVRYRDLLVKIFSDLSDSNNPRQFFFEPLVFLDPKSIVRKSNGFFNKNFIQLTLQMWNEELRSKVLERRLRSLESLCDVKIGEGDVCVMPFKQVQLIVYKPDGILKYARLLEDQPTSYLRSNENLDFHLLCDALPSSVDVLAEDFRQNTEFTLKEWQLKLECRGLTIKSGTTPVGWILLLSDECPTFSFNITTTHTNNESNNSKLLSQGNYLIYSDNEICNISLYNNQNLTNFNYFVLLVNIFFVTFFSLLLFGWHVDGSQHESTNCHHHRFLVSAVYWVDSKRRTQFGC